MQGASDYAQAQADLIRKQQQYLLDEAKKSEENRLKALETANQQAIDKLNQNKVTVNENADNLNRQEYLSKMLNQESLNQNLSRYRIGTSGARETSLNSLYANYGENVNKINTDRNQGLRDIDNQISDTNLSYETNRNSVLSEEAQRRLQLQQQIDAQAQSRYSEAYQWYVAEEERKEAQRRYEEELRQLEREYQLQKEQIALQREQHQREYELAKYQVYGSGSGYSLSGSSSGSYSKNGYGIVANPYTGTVNSDAQYGVFEWSNNPGTGYQPNNIGGSKLSKSGYKVKDVFANTAYGSTGISLANQSIWKTNGKYYIWDGSRNGYIDVTSKVKSSIKNKVTYQWGY